MTTGSLQQLFDPDRVLWIGPAGPPSALVAAAEANLWGGGFPRPILALRSGGAAPSAAQIEALAAVARGPGLAVIGLPQHDLGQVVGEAASAGCRAALLLGGGAGELALSPEAAAIAQARDIRLVGPDRVGVIVPAIRLTAGCVADIPPAGDLAFVTQSDSLATTLLGWAGERRIGFSRIISLGDSRDIELGDILDYLALDAATRAVLLHVQGIADARRFMSAARAAARVKPVIVLKSGREAGRSLLPGSDACLVLQRDRVHGAAFDRAGMVRAGSIEELFAAAASLGSHASRRGHGLRAGRLALVANGQAPAELAADALLAGGGTLARPDPAVLVAAQAWDGAIDLGLEATADAYAAALEPLLGQRDVDGVLVIQAPMAGVDPAAVAGAVAAVADRRKPRSAQRPVLAAWLGEASVAAARAAFDPIGVPVFATPESAVRAFLHRVRHERHQFLLRQVPASREETPDGRAAGERLARAALEAGRTSLSEREAMALLDGYGIPSAATRLAADLDAAADAAEELGYPVALKVVSAGMPQKSAVGGVALDVIDATALRRRGQEMLKSFAAMASGVPVEGLLVQRMERSLFPVELFMGMTPDPAFGPVLVLGQAARAISAADLTYLLPPLNAALAEAALAESAVGRFLVRQPEGARLAAGVVDALVRLSQLVVDLPCVQRIAIDPFLVSRERMVVLDAHVELAPVGNAAEADAHLAIRPYPRHLEQSARLRDGRTIRLRPIRPEDAPALKQLFAALTPEHRRLRLFSSMRELSDELAARLTQIDYDREMVLLALDPDQPSRFWAGARIAADAAGRRAEYSVTVRSDKQGLGLGRLCLERVLDYARSRGIAEIWGTVLAENENMLGLATKLGFSHRRASDSPDQFVTVKRLDGAA